MNAEGNKEKIGGTDTMERIMAVLDHDRVYAERLCSYANRMKYLPFHAVSFQDFQTYSRFADSHRVLLLIAEPELIGGEYELKADKVLSLCDADIPNGTGICEGSSLVSSDGAVYKYQSGEAILREAMSAVGDIGERFRLPAAQRQTRLIVVYSPLNRCYKSALALLYAVFCAKKERVFYLNLEPFSGLSHLMKESFQTGISDALYHYKQDTLDSSRISSLLHRFYEVDYIPPHHLAENLAAAETGDIAGLVETLMQETNYDCFVADIGGFSAAASELLELSDMIFMPVLQDPVSAGKLEEFDFYLEHAEKTHIRDKIRRLRLPEPGTIRRQEGYFDSILLSPLGDFVRGLV